MAGSDAQADGRGHHGDGGRRSCSRAISTAMCWRTTRPRARSCGAHATGKAIGGGVITYDVGGKQFVAAATGLNAPTWQAKAGPARVVVYALP